MKPCFELTGGLLAEMEKVHNAFLHGLEHLKQESLRAIRVVPGECLLCKSPQTEDDECTVVLGLAHGQGDGVDRDLKPGLNVLLSEDRQRLRAKAFGYLIVERDKVSILNPIRLSSDKMTACFVNLPPIGPSRAVSEKHLQDSLARLGVQHGVDGQVIASLCSGRLEERVVIVAQGTQPAGGEDGHLDLKVKVAMEPGKILEDGTIDYKDRNAVVNVPAGECIAVYRRATNGTSGLTVTGEPVAAASPGKDTPPRTGINVQPDEEGEVIRYLARESGHVRFIGNKLSVHGKYLVPGDVNFRTGNVDFLGDVEVVGAVMSGFTVKAGGSVTVAGGIDAGATVDAGEDVVVRHGIMGHNTSVRAGGSVLARYISNAPVQARGDILAGSYIHNANVTSACQIKVHGKGRLKRQTSAVVGGSLMAVEGMRIASAGSTFGSQTRLIAALDPEELERFQKIRAGLDFCNTNGARILRTLKVRDISEENLQKAIENAPQDKQSIFILLVAKLQELAKLRVKFQREQDRIREHQSKILQTATIRVDGMIYPGVQVQIGAVASPVLNVLEGVRFRLDIKTRRIIPEPLLEGTD